MINRITIKEVSLRQGFSVPVTNTALNQLLHDELQVLCWEQGTLDTLQGSGPSILK